MEEDKPCHRHEWAGIITVRRRKPNMKLLNPLKVGLPALAMTSALAFASASHAAITPFSEDFQGTFPVGFTDWTVFSDNAGMGSYTVIPPSASGPQISALADDGAGNQYLNFFANY